MTKQIKAMQAALTALKSIDAAMPFPVAKFAIHHLEEALAEALAEQPAQPYKGIADHINQATNGGVRIDPVTGALGLGTPSPPAQQALERMAQNARELGLDYDTSAGTQVSKVWWDGEKLMAKPIPFVEFYKPVQQEPTSGDYALGYAEGFNDACKPAQQEPVAWMQDSIELYVQDIPSATYTIPLYTSPPASKPLTDEELVDVASNCGMNGLNIHGYTFARAIEAAHGIKEST